jgi:hypothetical protein
MHGNTHAVSFDKTTYALEILLKMSLPGETADGVGCEGDKV